MISLQKDFRTQGTKVDLWEYETVSVIRQVSTEVDVKVQVGCLSTNYYARHELQYFLEQNGPY